MTVTDKDGKEICVGTPVKVGGSRGVIVDIYSIEGVLVSRPKVVVRFTALDESWFNDSFPTRRWVDSERWICEAVTFDGCVYCGGSGVRCCEFGADKAEVIPS